MFAEMRERGVLPDLLPPDVRDVPEAAEFFSDCTELGSRRIEVATMPPGKALFAWARVPAEFEAKALEVLSAEDVANRRRLRLSPRYLGPVAGRGRSITCDQETAAMLAGLGPLADWLSCYSFIRSSFKGISFPIWINVPSINW